MITPNTPESSTANISFEYDGNEIPDGLLTDEALVDYIEQLRATTDKTEILPEQTALMLRTFHESFKISQGSPDLQLYVMEHNRRHLPKMTEEEINTTTEKMFQHLILTYSKFQLPSRHTKELAEEPTPKNIEFVALKQYYDRLNDFSNILSGKAVLTMREGAQPNVLHQMTDEALAFELLDGITIREAEYLVAGRPNRNTIKEQTRSYYRDILSGKMRARSPLNQALYADVAEVANKLHVNTPNLAYKLPADADLRQMGIDDANRPMMVHRRHHQVVNAWESWHDGEAFVEGQPGLIANMIRSETPDDKALRYAREIEVSRQIAINGLSTLRKLDGDLDEKWKIIIEELELKPNFVSMRNTLVETHRDVIDEIVGTESLNEKQEHAVREFLGGKLLPIVNRKDMTDADKGSVREQIKAALEEEMAEKFVQLRQEHEVQERFISTKRALAKTALQEPSPAKITEEPIKSSHSEIVVPSLVPTNTIGSMKKQMQAQAVAASKIKNKSGPTKKL